METELIQLDPSEVAELELAKPGFARIVERVESTGEGNTPTVLRHTHHQIARLVALGTKTAEIALISGYSTGYISDLQHQPAFANLVAHYAGKVEEIFVDTAKRLKELGLVAAEVALERLTVNPKDWTRKDIKDIIELCFGKGAGNGLDGSTRGGGKGAPPVAIEVTFVQPAQITGPTIEGFARRVEQHEG